MQNAHSQHYYECYGILPVGRPSNLYRHNSSSHVGTRLILCIQYVTVTFSAFHEALSELHYSEIAL